MDTRTRLELIRRRGPDVTVRGEMYQRFTACQANIRCEMTQHSEIPRHFKLFSGDSRSSIICEDSFVNDPPEIINIVKLSGMTLE